MKTVSALVYLCRKVLFIMAWFSSDRLRSSFEWFWRRLCLLWRCITSMFRPIVGYAFLAIRCGSNLGRRREEIGEEGQPAVRGCEGQYVTEGGEERPAAGDREPTSALPGCGEEAYTSDSSSDGPDPRHEELEDDDEFDSETYRVETTDEFYCGYDSTWETEDTVRSSRRPAASRHYKFSRFENAAKDMQNYRHDYPNMLHRRIVSRFDGMPNLNFYLGRTPSVPDGAYIHDFHKEWFRDYDALEYVHTYIQWLFPLQEPGVNYEASPLTKEEIECFLENSTAKLNLLESYKLMLDFYGIELCDETTGEVKRALNWRDRFNNLNTHTHNNLRITRILKCQGTLGYSHYQAPLVHFFLEETLVNRQLPNVKDSVLNYFVFAVRDTNERRRLIKFAYLNYDRKDEFVWCPKKIQMKWSRLSSAQATKWSY